MTRRRRRRQRRRRRRESHPPRGQNQNFQSLFSRLDSNEPPPVAVAAVIDCAKSHIRFTGDVVVHVVDGGGGGVVVARWRRRRP
jgi:hypothetical protein